MMQVPTMKKASWSAKAPSFTSSSNRKRAGRVSTLNIRHSDGIDDTHLPPETTDALQHCDIEYNEEECAITAERLRRAHDTCLGGGGGGGSKSRRDRRTTTCKLTAEEMQKLRGEQHTIRRTLFQSTSSSFNNSINNSINKPVLKLGGTIKAGGTNLIGGMQSVGNKVAGGTNMIGGMQSVGNKFGKMGLSIKEQMQMALIGVDEEEELEDKKVGEGQEKLQGQGQNEKDEIATSGRTQSCMSNLDRPQDDDQMGSGPSFHRANSAPEDSTKSKRSLGTVKAQFMNAKLRARLCDKEDGVLGVQDTKRMNRYNSIMGDKFMMYNMRMSVSSINANAVPEEEEEEEVKEMDVEDISYVRKPNMARIIEEYEAMQNHPKYTLKQVVLSRRFHLYAHRFGNAQYQRTLVYPTLQQPEELYTCPWLMKKSNNECQVITEKQRTRTKGHRFVIAADTQFGILMDGFAMDYPNWSQEIEISRKCVAQINAMRGLERPLFVCVCGDLVDTESSFSGAIASWKKVMSGWERNLVFEQQVKDFKRVWAGLDPDIALVCLCGNHDVGNRPTRASIRHWTSSFGDDFLSFWVNGTYNICMNNCLFSNPTGAPDLFEEQLQWLEERLAYARENDATHIFVYGHFPWFLKHEEEADDFLTSYSKAPAGWGPPGSSFADSYFTIPYEQRKIAMALFKKYDVTACFSGHFHQNVVAQTSWGMPMIVTGPLSMNLDSDIAHELSNGETNGIGMRVVDVGEKGKFTHKWLLLDHADELYESGMERCIRQNALERGERGEAEEAKEDAKKLRNSLFDSVFGKAELQNESEKWRGSNISVDLDIGNIDIANINIDDDIDVAEGT